LIARTSLRELRLKPRNSILGEMRVARGRLAAAVRGQAASELPTPRRAAVLPSEIACERDGQGPWGFTSGFSVASLDYAKTWRERMQRGDISVHWQRINGARFTCLEYLETRRLPQ